MTCLNPCALAPPLFILGGASGCVDGGPDGARHEVEDVQHLREVVTAKVDHQVAQAEPLVLREAVDDGLLTLSEQLVAQGEAEGQRERLERPPGRVGRGTEACERVAQLGRGLVRRVPAVAERDDAPERARAVAPDPDRGPA